MALFGASPVESGESVTPASAMRVPAVACAVRAIAEGAASLPLHLYSRDGDSRKRDRDHPVAHLISRPNEWTGRHELVERVTIDALTHRNGGFAFVNRVGGEARELLRLDPSRVTVTVDEVTGEPIYRLHEGADLTRPIPREDVLHIKPPGGDSPVYLAREAIGLALTLERHAARLFANGGRPSGVLSFDKSLGAEVAKRISESWHSAHAGTSSGKTAVLEEGGKFLPLAFNSVDSQFLELRKFAIDEIARAFRVPPTFLMDFGRATWANAESMRRDFVDFTLRRWLSAWEDEIALKLLAGDDDHFVEFLLDDFLKGDSSARMDAYGKAIANRILSPNEVRQMENRPPYAGGDTFANPNTTAVAA